MKLVFQENLPNQFHRSGKRHKFAKIAKPAFNKPTLLVFEIRIPPDSTYCENFGRFHRRKFKKITDIKTVKNAYVKAFIIPE